MCVKKFIFSKFAVLQAYSWQLYYQVNSFTGIFRQHFKPPMLSPCIDLSPPIPVKFWRAPPPPNGGGEGGGCGGDVLNTCGEPWTTVEMNITLKFTEPHLVLKKIELFLYRLSIIYTPLIKN